MGDHYAGRQVRFVRDSVLCAAGNSEPVGVMGTLRVTVVAAHKLRNADGFMNLSDPYCQVEVGLQRLSTPVIKDNLNPQWNCNLAFAVDKFHLDQDIQFDVWDEDTAKAVQGSDAFLGC